MNPAGFAKRVATLFGPASEDWSSYPKTFEGRVAIVHDTLLALPRYASWPLAVIACVGVAVAASPPRGLPRLRALFPLLGAASFTLFFTLGARRTEDRFLLPQSVLFFPYAAFALEAGVALVERRAHLSNAVVAAGCVVVLFPSLLAVASVDATLLVRTRATPRSVF